MTNHRFLRKGIASLLMLHNLSVLLGLYSLLIVAVLLIALLKRLYTQTKEGELRNTPDTGNDILPFVVALVLAIIVLIIIILLPPLPPCTTPNVCNYLMSI